MTKTTTNTKTTRALLCLTSLLALSLAGCTESDDGDPPAPGPTPGAMPGGTPATPPGTTPGGAKPTPSTPAARQARFFLPTGVPTNTSAPTVEIDAAGGVHMVYPAYARGNAYYAYCPKDCPGPAAVKVVQLDTDGTVHNAMLALDAEGRPRVLLSTMMQVHFASCDGGCTDPARWKKTMIVDHRGDREVSGEAFALDPQGRPRFVMHTYRAFLGIGQKAPETLWWACDGDCHVPASWRSSVMQKQIWEGSHLRFDAQGRAHLATVAGTPGPNGAQKLAAYVLCERGCETEADWNGLGLFGAFESETDAVKMRPAVSLALTRAGAPRVLVLGRMEGGKRSIVYFACDRDCAKDNWEGSIISNHDRIGAGLDLALDRDDHPRFVYTLDYNIGLAHCDAARCAVEDAKWDLTKVELSSELPRDEIFLHDNCTIAAWFFHSPSIALDADGRPRVGYQARDISGGLSRPDPTKPRCVAGTDMTWSRLAVMPSHK
jgi:hypothetical protein